MTTTAMAITINMFITVFITFTMRGNEESAGWNRAAEAPGRGSTRSAACGFPNNTNIQNAPMGLWVDDESIHLGVVCRPMFFGGGWHLPTLEGMFTVRGIHHPQPIGSIDSLGQLWDATVCVDSIFHTGNFANHSPISNYQVKSCDQMRPIPCQLCPRLLAHVLQESAPETLTAAK